MYMLMWVSVKVMVFNAIFNNISVISVEETVEHVPGENLSHISLTNFITK